MEQVKTDIENALDLIYKRKNYSQVFSKYSSSFLFGTENQSGINNVIDYQDKDVLTVASSADQYLGASYYGAKIIDIFDINRFSYYITYLKIIAIMNLDYEKFLSFFIPNYNEKSSKSFWNLKTLKKLLPFLPPDVAYFWDSIMYTLHKRNYGDFISPTHKHTHYSNVKRGMPFYENAEEYYRLQAILKSRELPHFIESDILNLKDVVTSSYDIIYLSNIIECLVCNELNKYFMPSYETENRAEEELIFKIAKQVLPLLKDNGTILMDYRPNSQKSEAFDVLFTNDYFDTNEVRAKYPSQGQDTVTESDTDLVLTYKPKKTGNILTLLK